MGAVSLYSYWPYDELRIEGDCTQGFLQFSTPWLKVGIEVNSETEIRVKSVLEKLSSGGLAAEDLAEVTWVLTPVAHLPLAYILPRTSGFESRDIHPSNGETFVNGTPKQLLERLGKLLSPASVESAALERVVPQLNRVLSQWNWDIEAALAFSETANGHDPASLLSVARRFHLLESAEKNKTNQFYEILNHLKSDKNRFRKAVALVVRQNHYVTQKCESALKPSLLVAQNARKTVEEFMRAEKGHDVLLSRALVALGISRPESIQVMDSVVVLMELFRLVAQRNFLAFSMIVDIFERSSYSDKDPLASVLSEGGEELAAKQLDLHRQINDEGEHENVALGFLEKMAAVDARYATEALRLAELATVLLHQLSADLWGELSVELPSV